ncbi:MAG TPA: branched-chain-amino-acid transaminase [Candidatus Kryptonia bacterium]|nr:branched-chain-amino-acid transaminase [Candidatus Kryptonia bacterium]
MEIYVDGQWYPRDAARVSVFDHGLLYGDGVFEGIRVYSRRIFRLDAHLDRLYASARALALTIPLERAQMAATVREAVARNRKDDGYIRLVVTRGAGDLGIDPRKCAAATVIIIVTDIAVYPREQYASGIKVMTSATRQVSHEAFDPRVKSLNYLKNVLAKIDANRSGVHEAIMLNADGFVAECTADNLFVVRSHRLLTPSPQDGALEGITRGAILQLAAEAGMAANETRLTRYDVYTADECFVSGTGAELMPVTEVDGRPIADGKPGAITRRLTEAFQALVRNEGEPVW